MAQTSKMQIYQDAIETLINESVMLPPEVLSEIQDFIEENTQLGFATKEELIRDAIRFRLTWLNDESKCVEVPKEQYEKLSEAVKGMNPPYQSVEDFLSSQISEALGKYEQ